MYSWASSVILYCFTGTNIEQCNVHPCTCMALIQPSFNTIHLAWPTKTNSSSCTVEPHQWYFIVLQDRGLESQNPNLLDCPAPEFALRLLNLDFRRNIILFIEDSAILPLTNRPVYIWGNWPPFIYLWVYRSSCPCYGTAMALAFAKWALLLWALLSLLHVRANCFLRCRRPVTNQISYYW